MQHAPKNRRTTSQNVRKRSKLIRPPSKNAKNHQKVIRGAFDLPSFTKHVQHGAQHGPIVFATNSTTESNVNYANIPQYANVYVQEYRTYFFIHLNNWICLSSSKEWHRNFKELNNHTHLKQNHNHSWFPPGSSPTKNQIPTFRIWHGVPTWCNWLFPNEWII